jgi:hypothetical protein
VLGAARARRSAPTRVLGARARTARARASRLPTMALTRRRLAPVWPLQAPFAAAYVLVGIVRPAAGKLAAGSAAATECCGGGTLPSALPTAGDTQGGDACDAKRERAISSDAPPPVSSDVSNECNAEAASTLRLPVSPVAEASNQGGVRHSAAGEPVELHRGLSLVGQAPSAAIAAAQTKAEAAALLATSDTLHPTCQNRL